MRKFLVVVMFLVSVGETAAGPVARWRANREARRNTGVLPARPVGQCSGVPNPTAVCGTGSCGPHAVTVPHTAVVTPATCPGGVCPAPRR